MGEQERGLEARRLAAIVESSDDAIISKDLNGIVQSWNRAAQKIFGYTAEEMIGQSIRRIIPADRQSEEDDVVAKIRAGDNVDHFETIRQAKDGTLLPISLTISPIRDDTGRVIGASKIARDIRDRRDADAERAHLLALAEDSALAAEHASQIKDEFLATLSHELRTPLNAILGYARMANSGMLSPEKLPRAIETIERNATSLAQIVEDVLDVSRIVSGKMRLDVQTLDLAALVRDSIEAVQPGADAKGITITTALESGPGPVSGDPQRLQQVIWNLLSNAVKFTGGGGRVEVRVARVGGHVELSVADSGVGIAPEFMPHIFERFRQADAGTTRERGGLGLGLAIVRQLVELHGGTVGADSGGVGRGSTFVVSLPLAAAARPVPVNLFDLNSPLMGNPTDLRGVVVLAVDDDADALEMIRDILESAGATVATASSVAMALTLLEQVLPDVLVSDLAMPVVDGFALIAEIRRHTNPRIRPLPALALTAYARSEDRTKAIRRGFQAHLAKPIEPTELTATVLRLSRDAKAK